MPKCKRGQHGVFGKTQLEGFPMIVTQEVDFYSLLLYVLLI